MNYEKKYKDAQKWVESILPELSHEQRVGAKVFFPELAESEDEKIIDAIKHGLKCLGWAHVDDIKVSDMIAWLEKLKEKFGCEVNCTTKKE